MNLRKEYTEMLELEGFLYMFPMFTGEWELDKDLFKEMSEAPAELFGDIGIEEEED